MPPHPLPIFPEKTQRYIDLDFKIKRSNHLKLASKMAPPTRSPFKETNMQQPKIIQKPQTREAKFPLLPHPCPPTSLSIIILMDTPLLQIRNF